MTKALSDFKALTFDCYGTMIDWETGIWDGLQPLFMANGCDLTRQDTLQAYARVESQQQADTPDMLYPPLLARVHKTLADELNLATTSELDEAFGNSLAHWPAFEDSADALRILKKHFKLVILSNVNRDGFASSNRKLGVEFDAIYTAQDVGSYKPNQQNFDYMLTHLKSDLGLEVSNILHTAQSLFHDHVPATKAGLAKCWIDRQNLADSEDWGATAIVENRPQTDFKFNSLMQMAEAL